MPETSLPTHEHNENHLNIVNDAEYRHSTAPVGENEHPDQVENRDGSGCDIG